MTWAMPSLLAALLLVPVVAVMAFVGWRRRCAALLEIASVELLVRLVPPGAGRARGWQAACAVVAACALGLAMAGPRLGFDYQQRKVQGVSIVVVLDVSRSMDAGDVSPSRLEVARRKVRDFSQALTGDSVGLVVFAAGAFARIPLTVDYDTFRWAVDDSSSGTIRAQGTSLGGAINAATQMLARAQGSGKAILLVSDGEAHDDASEVTAAVDRAKQEGIRIYALGVGDPAGAPIPMAEGGFKNDAAGGVVLTRLNEPRLKALASATGGAYVRAVASNDDVRALYQDEIRGKLEASERGERREKVWRERFQWPLVGGFLALVVSALMGIGRRRSASGSGAASAVVMAFVFASPLVANASSTSDGLAAYEQKNWEDAARLLGQARVEDPTDVAVGHALAESLYRTGRYREAEQVFESLAASDTDHKGTHLYNAGNSAYRGGRLDDAARDFAAASLADPSLAGAKKNGEAVEKEIALRLRAKPPDEKQDSDGDKNGEEGEDQQADAGEKQQEEDGVKQEESDDKGELEQGNNGAEQGANGGQEDAVEGPSAGDMAKQDGVPDETTTVAEPSDQPGVMSREDAARLVEGVKDGTPRVAVGGQDTEKDW